MPVKINPANQIEQRLGLENGGPVHAFFTATCAKAMDKFVPYDTGALAETVIYEGQPTSNVTVDTITYAQNYAKIVYEGVRNGENLNYQTDTHEFAGPYWNERMWTAQGKDIIQQVQDYLERGGK